MTHSHLRRIAVFVDEPDPGAFYWVIIESTDDAAIWTDLEAAEESKTTWGEAFAAGNQALLKLVPDQKLGPRGTGEDENASPVG